MHEKKITQRAVIKKGEEEGNRVALMMRSACLTVEARGKGGGGKRTKLTKTGERKGGDR